MKFSISIFLSFFTIINIANAQTDDLNYFSSGLAKADLGDKKEAIEDYTKAIEIDPKNASAYHNRGLAKVDLGDEKGALEDYVKAIELNPRYILYKKVIDLVNLVSQ